MAAALDFTTAQRLAEAVLSRGVALGCKPLCVVVSDLSGTPLVLLRDDGAPPMWATIAIAKAKTALAFGQPTAWVGELAEQRPLFMTSVMTLAEGAVAAAAGGIVLKADGVIIGGVGVSGDTSENDALCAQQAAEACGFDPA